MKQFDYCDMNDYFSMRRKALSLSQVAVREISRIIDRFTLCRLLQLCDLILQKLMLTPTDQLPVLRNAVMAVHRRSSEELFKVLRRRFPKSYQYHERGE